MSRPPRASVAGRVGAAARGELTEAALDAMLAAVRPDPSQPAAVVVNRRGWPGEMVVVLPGTSAAEVLERWPEIAADVQAVRHRHPGRAVLVASESDWRALERALLQPVSPVTGASVSRARIYGIPVHYAPERQPRGP